MMPKKTKKNSRTYLVEEVPHPPKKIKIKNKKYQRHLQYKMFGSATACEVSIWFSIINKNVTFIRENFTL
jgi:hypothetical protein